jgi:endonuclease/exonuclease/phosphatase family metal-dependent hydrolase
MRSIALFFLFSSVGLLSSQFALAGSEIVLHASDYSNKSGNWTLLNDTSAASGQALYNKNYGAAKISSASAAPASYFDMTFYAEAGVGYRMWLRSKAENNYYGNDSVYAQFSDSVNSSGTAIYRIGTSSGSPAILEECSGAGVTGWGWNNSNGWCGTSELIYFKYSGSHVIRIQAREDGVTIDQIVLSASKYLGSSPGVYKNDTLKLTANDGSISSTPSPTPAPTPTPSSKLRVMVWNVKHGNAGVSVLTKEMYASGATVFLLNEVRDYNYKQYETSMETLTGKTWYSIFVLGNGSDGNVILSLHPFESTQTARWTAPYTSGCYPTRGAARAAIRYNGVLINLFVFHNDVCVNNQIYLVQKLVDFMEPTKNTPQILGGDFNYSDNGTSLRYITNTSSPYYGYFYDGWTYVTGQTGSSSSNKTHEYRIDYQFISRAYIAKVKPVSIWLRNFDFSLSDHRSVIADYLVTP